MRFSEAVALGIQNLDEHWDGGGKPTGARGEAIPIYAQIALIAQVVDVFHAATDPECYAALGRALSQVDAALVA